MYGGKQNEDQVNYCQACGENLKYPHLDSSSSNNNPGVEGDDKKTSCSDKYNNKVDDVPQIRPWVRYWARMIDYTIAGFILGFVTNMFDLNVSDSAYTDSFIACIGWMFIEPLLLAKFGTTFGKWILGTRVEDSSGNNLSYKKALLRSFRVWLIGMGAFIPIVNLIALIASYYQLKNNGTTLWDKGESIVNHEKIGILKTINAVLVIVAPIVYSASLK